MAEPENTDVTLRDFLERIMDERFKAHQALHEKSDNVLESRLQALNELRELVSDIKGANVTREYYDSEQNSVKGQINRVTDRVGAIEGRFLGISLAAVSLGAAGVVIGLVK